jgi:hypothetical protein
MGPRAAAEEEEEDIIQGHVAVEVHRLQDPLIRT